MNGETDKSTRAIIAGLVIICATALLFYTRIEPEQWERVVLFAGGGYFIVKQLKDSLQRKNGNGAVSENLTYTVNNGPS